MGVGVGKTCFLASVSACVERRLATGTIAATRGRGATLLPPDEAVDYRVAFRCDGVLFGIPAWPCCLDHWGAFRLSRPQVHRNPPRYPGEVCLLIPDPIPSARPVQLQEGFLHCIVGVVNVLKDCISDTKHKSGLPADQIIKDLALLRCAYLSCQAWLLKRDLFGDPGHL